MTLSCPIQSSLNTKAIQDGIEWDKEVWLDKRAEEIKAAILSEDGYTVNSATYSISDVMETIAKDELRTTLLERGLQSLMDGGNEIQFWAKAKALTWVINSAAHHIAKQLAADELAAMNSDEGV